MPIHPRTYDAQGIQSTQHEEATAALDIKAREIVVEEEALKNKTERLDREQKHLEGERHKVNNFSTPCTTFAPIKYNISKLVDLGVLYALYQSMLLYC